MLLVSWSAGGVTTAAAYARAFYAFIGPALLPGAAMWTLTGVPEHAVLGVLIVIFGLLQIFLVRDNERVVRTSFSIRYDNERLMKALEVERQEAALARDRAEDANHAKSRFLAAASHDLRQPLQALRMHLSALGAASGDEVLRASITRKMGHAVNGLTDILDTLLDVARLDMNQVQPKII